MVFCNSNRKFLNLTRPTAGAFAVEVFPDQRKAADAVKQAGHCRLCGSAEAQAAQDKRPGRESNAIAQRLVAGAILALFLEFAGAVYPRANIGPQVGKALEPFTLHGREAADSHALSDTGGAVEALAATRMRLQGVENIRALCAVAAINAGHHKISGILVVTGFHG